MHHANRAQRRAEEAAGRISATCRPSPRIRMLALAKHGPKMAANIHTMLRAEGALTTTLAAAGAIPSAGLRAGGAIAATLAGTGAIAQAELTEYDAGAISATLAVRGTLSVSGTLTTEASEAQQNPGGGSAEPERRTVPRLSSTRARVATLNEAQPAQSETLTGVVFERGGLIGEAPAQEERGALLAQTRALLVESAPAQTDHAEALIASRSELRESAPPQQGAALERAATVGRLAEECPAQTEALLIASTIRSEARGEAPA